MVESQQTLSANEISWLRETRDECIEKDEEARALELTNVLAVQSALGLTAADIFAQARALFIKGQRCMHENLRAAQEGKQTQEAAPAKVFLDATRNVFLSAVHRAVQEEKSGERELSPMLVKCWFGLRQLGASQVDFDQLVFRLRRERDDRRRFSQSSREQ